MSKLQLASSSLFVIIVLVVIIDLFVVVAASTARRTRITRDETTKVVAPTAMAVSLTIVTNALAKSRALSAMVVGLATVPDQFLAAAAPGHILTLLAKAT